METIGNTIIVLKEETLRLKKVVPEKSECIEQMQMAAQSKEQSDGLKMEESLTKIHELQSQVQDVHYDLESAKYREAVNLSKIQELTSLLEIKTSEIHDADPLQASDMSLRLLLEEGSSNSILVDFLFENASKNRSKGHFIMSSEEPLDDGEWELETPIKKCRKYTERIDFKASTFLHHFTLVSIKYTEC
jgi:hypothetical protein